MRRSRSTGHDPPRPPQVSKRQRTMMDAFENLAINNCDKKPPAVPRAQAIDPATTIITSLSSDDDEDDDEAMSDEGFSHQEKAARDVMYKLALGSSAALPKDSVDAKLESMIRKTRLQLAFTNKKPRDDFDVETPYTHTSVMKNTMNFSRTRQRSNSLPRDWEGPAQQADAESMDVDMML